jgi:hypothetical protein
LREVTFEGAVFVIEGIAFLEWMDTSKESEVIGNIWENPKLLTQA